MAQEPSKATWRQGLSPHSVVGHMFLVVDQKYTGISQLLRTEPGGQTPGSSYPAQNDGHPIFPDYV
ncbi:hypothetical protein SNOG_14134 [Parastagonospora nodorum SN15]|uniref:Uncharacterized protein n=2 Tax=Phaeosphaeria nodorum (strain SN15 / ATCC MYA-4574 / FGSC 10173) TaxID=321614 RepID=Q0U1W5_PHANO|nr:hypothetical protein SNOG_14134 [Parastagonospora nodorum SN15]EAT78371.1 hypothetical protein SNOG_14134 [Parastagonospora nodorum SN15]